ncbi:MAG: metallophosphoesterase [Clostridia bacterium]|nr:metallophosphoesterase [Clostridia bacterium]
MAKYKKLVSIVLATALLLTSVFVGGISVSANLDDLYSTVNDYDNLPEGVEFNTVEYADRPATNVVINGSPEMEDSSSIRHFSARSAWVDTLPADIGSGKALHFKAADSGDRSNIYQTIARIYRSESATVGHFKPTAGKTYEVKLKYFVAEAPSKEIEIQIRQAQWSQCSYQNPNGNDGIWMEPAVIASISAQTVGWVEATAYFTAPSPAYYMNLCLASPTSGGASNVDVWVDDVTVSECVKITAYNYAPDENRSVPVSKLTTIGDLKPETIPGYRFGGVFANEELTERIPAEEKAGNYSQVYFSWLPITADQGYCGFEDYAQPVLGTSYNSAVSSLAEGDAFVGKYTMKTTLGNKGVAAFELKNANTFNITGGKTYTVSLVYKTDKAAEIYAGTGVLGNVPETAKALTGQKVSATDEWTELTFSVTPEKGTNENFALALLVYAEDGATVLVDDVLVSGFEQGYVNPTLNTGFTSDWYPSLALFEGVELPKVWGGQNDLSAPKDTNNDGVYEIGTAAELAYTIKNGGAADAKYILTNDIYLNNVSAINWETGEVIVDGYVPNTWFNQAVSFQGSIDGDGHTIYGLYRKDNPSSMISYAGYGTALVPKVPDNGTVSFENLAVDYAFINVECGSGAFVGTTQCSYQGGTSITIDGCYVGENAQFISGDAGAFVGYTGGSGCAITLNNSYSLATTSGTKNHGLVAFCYQATLLVKNCYNANGPITTYTNGNWTGNYTIKNTYQTEVNGTDKYYYPTNFETISADNMKGTDVFSAGKMEFLNLSNAYIATEGFPRLAFFEGVEIPEIWLGTSDTSAPKDTNGDGVLEINNGAELAYAISTGGGEGYKYIITKDIYLNDTAKFNWETGEVVAGETVNSWSYYNVPFQGSIDGDGHTIYGLYYKDSSPKSWAIQGVGLIPRVNFGTTCEVKNLAIDNSYMYGHAGASAFVGCGGTGNDYSEVRAEIIIDRCFVGEKVTVDGTSAGAFRGATRGSNTTITNSYSLGTITGSDYGLVAGESWESTVIMTNVYNGNGPLGSAASGTFTNCYQTVAGAYSANVVSAVDMQGKSVLTNASQMPGLNADDAFYATDAFPALKVFDKSVSSDTPEEGEQEESEIVIWGGQGDVSAPLDSDGDRVYEIYTPAEFAYIIANFGTMNGVAGCSFILKNDIYLNDITKLNIVNGNGNTLNAWYRYAADNSVGFTGTIDGDGHTVYGLYFNNTNSFGNYAQYGVGLVPAAKGEVTVKNLKVDYSWIRYEGYASVFCGIGRSGTTLNIEGCIAGANIHHYAYGVGAFCGNGIDMTTNITNSYSLANLHANGGAYGMVSTTSGNVNIASSYIVGAPVFSENKAFTSVKNTYESVKSGGNNGAILVSENNMKGDDVLTNPNKMPQLAFASAYVPASLDFEDHDYYIYLPTGTILAEDYEPSFLDSFLDTATADEIMDGNTMKKSAYVRFEKEPAANKILVPSALASLVRQGGYEAISSDSVHDDYYGIEVETVSKQLSVQSKDAINYIFITDIHFMNYDLSWDKSGNVLLEQMRLITDWANKDDSIDFIVVGGDSVQGFWDTKEGWKDAITNAFEPFKASEKPVLILTGNHDDNSYATWNANYGAKVISELDWKNYVLDPISPANIVHPEGEPNSKHYYYDFEKNGKTTRLFFLDAIDYYQEYDDENGNITALEIRKALGYTEEDAEDYSKYYNGRSYFGYSGAQVKWLADSLADTDEFDNVMVFSHMGTDSTTSTAEFGAEIADVMAAYNNKTAYTNEALGIDVAYDDEGKILAYQFGHIHKELSVYNAAADLWQIATSTARADQGSRTLGNADEACFDAMSVSSSGVYKFGLGASESKTFISKANTVYGDVNLDNTVDICDMVAAAQTVNGDFSKTTAADVNRDNLITFAEDIEAIKSLILGK